MFRSEDMEMRRGREWCHIAVKTCFLWALIDCEGLWVLDLISKIWIIWSTEPEVMYKPSGDHVWFIRADWESLLSCFHPNAWSSVCLNVISNNRSCFSGVLHKRHVKYSIFRWISLIFRFFHYAGARTRARRFTMCQPSRQVCPYYISCTK